MSQLTEAAPRFDAYCVMLAVSMLASCMDVPQNSLTG